MKTNQTGLCVIIGGGGHAKVLIDSLRRADYNFHFAILEKDRSLWGEELHGVPVLGDDSLLPELVDQGASRFVIGVGGVADTRPRRKLFEWASSYGLEPLTIIHPSSLASSWAKVGPGCQL